MIKRKISTIFANLVNLVNFTSYFSETNTIRRLSKATLLVKFYTAFLQRNHSHAYTLIHPVSGINKLALAQMTSKTSFMNKSYYVSKCNSICIWTFKIMSVELKLVCEGMCLGNNK